MRIDVGHVPKLAKMLHSCLQLATLQLTHTKGHKLRIGAYRSEVIGNLLTAARTHPSPGQIDDS